MTRNQLVRMRRTLLAGVIGAMVLRDTAHAQQVYWDTPTQLAAGQRGALDLVFDDTRPAGHVAPPHADGLTVVGPPSQQSSTSITNGRRSDSLTLRFPVRAEREGTVTIPAFDVETAAGTSTVAPLVVEVGAAMLPGGGRSAAATVSDVVGARLTPSDMAPYAGQVFDLDVTIGLTGGRSGQVVGKPAWEKPGIVVEPWSDGTPVSTHGGSGVRFHTRAVAPQPGRIEVAPVQQEVQIETGRERVDPFDGSGDALGALRHFGGTDLLDSFFSRAQTTDATVKSNAAQLDVRALPQPAPEGFTGAVGQFELESSLAPQEPKSGEPITWTLTLKGTGNWPGGVALPARAVPTEFRTLQPKQHKEFAAGEVFSGALSEDVVVIPNQPGDYRLDPVRFVYFDPAAGQYRTVAAQPPVLHVTGVPLAAQPKADVVPAAQPAAAPLAAARAGAPATPSHDAPLPRDPLSGSATARAPIAAPRLALLVGAPFALLILSWLALAAQHARRTDPRRPRREAFKRLAAAIERIRGAATAAERIAALLAWQHTAALALGLDLAAPTAAQLRDARWVDVWTGSERALYGREHALPPGWCDRALAVCTHTRRPRFNPLRALTVRNLVPKVAAAAVLLACTMVPARAAAPLDAYTNGDFAGARKQLLARAKDAPSDWIARYDLGLAEAQLGDAPRALAETVAAFVHAPRNADVRWNANAFAARVPGFDRAAAALLALPGIAALASPSAWQVLLVAGAVVFCSGAAVLLRQRYRSGPSRRWIGLVPLVVGAVIGGTAAVGLRAYGPLADPRAALLAAQPVLRSVPTDAEQSQQQKPLAAGTLVVVEQDFLGWVKVGLRGGETGWLRQGDVVPLYAAPSA